MKSKALFLSLALFILPQNTHVLANSDCQIAASASVLAASLIVTSLSAFGIWGYDSCGRPKCSQSENFLCCPKGTVNQSGFVHLGPCQSWPRSAFNGKCNSFPQSHCDTKFCESHNKTHFTRSETAYDIPGGFSAQATSIVGFVLGNMLAATTGLLLTFQVCVE